MSTGEILDRTFTMYRNHFWLFVGISALPPALMLMVNLTMTGTIVRPAGMTAGPSTTTVMIAGIGAIVGAIAYMFGLAIAHGATVFAVSAVHLGRTITIAEAYRRMKGHYGRVIGLLLVLALMGAGAAFVLIFGVALLVTTFAAAFRGAQAPWVAGVLTVVLILAAAVLIVWVFLRFSLSIAACVLENLKIGPSLKRSRFLARGSLGKIFVIYLLLLALNLGVSFVLLLPIQLLVLVFKGPTGIAVVAVLQHMATFATGALIGPLATIALALVYYDERVRKEAFDIHFMMEALDGPPPALNIPNAPIG